jgi:hypothetical protein
MRRLNFLIRTAIHCLSCLLQCRSNYHSLDVALLQESLLNIELLSGQRSTALSPLFFQRNVNPHCNSVNMHCVGFKSPKPTRDQPTFNSKFVVALLSMQFWIPSQIDPDCESIEFTKRNDRNRSLNLADPFSRKREGSFRAAMCRQPNLDAKIHSLDEEMNCGSVERLPTWRLDFISIRHWPGTFLDQRRIGGDFATIKADWILWLRMDESVFFASNRHTKSNFIGFCERQDDRPTLWRRERTWEFVAWTGY